MRYRFYREHKYVSYRLTEFERLVAKTDFNDLAQINDLKDQLTSLESLMNGHAHWENTSIHELLREKHSEIHKNTELEHQNHEKQFKQFFNLLNKIIENINTEESLLLGYHFYLNYRLFVSDNLKHLHEEETIIMPELQKLYSDDELRAREFNTYNQMMPEEMAHMIEELFPHMNSNDKNAILKDIKDSEPEKFSKLLINPRIYSTTTE